jgi:hypothetical protein
LVLVALAVLMDLLEEVPVITPFFQLSLQQAEARESEAIPRPDQAVLAVVAAHCCIGRLAQYILVMAALELLGKAIGDRTAPGLVLLTVQFIMLAAVVVLLSMVDLMPLAKVAMG